MGALERSEIVTATYVKAQKALEQNTHTLISNGREYRRVLPSPEYYTHQWFWDSCTHAMGLVHVDPKRASDELESLVSGQWENGLIGHITFDPESTTYFPGPKIWGTESFAEKGVISSGIVQPPLLSIALEHMLGVTENKAFAEKMLPHVMRYHQYLKKYRDPENTGLIVMVHPWESGTDNSPRWDSMLEKIKITDIPEKVIDLVNTSRQDNKKGDSGDRPKNEDYYRYLYLVDLYKSWGWDYKKIVAESPFVVKDAFFNSLWGSANESLGNILTQLGRKDEAATYFSWAEQTKDALGTLWDKEHNVFLTLDVAQKRNTLIREDTIATFLPIYPQAVSDEVLSSLLKKLTDPNQYWTEYPVPSISVANQEKFNTSNYWRGPTWPITNLFIIEGLDKYGDKMECKMLRDLLVDKTINMIADHGFYEHYDPFDGMAKSYKTSGGGMGFATFSWSAAIFIYLVNKYRPEYLQAQEQKGDTSSLPKQMFG